MAQCSTRRFHSHSAHCAKVFKALLAFLYGVVPSHEQEEEPEMLAALFVAADKYDVADLKAICQGRYITVMQDKNIPTSHELRSE